MSVSNRIREVAKANSFTIKDLSDRTGVKYRTIQNYLADDRGIGSDFLTALSTQLNVSASWVLTGDGPMYLSAIHPNEGTDIHTKSTASSDFIPIPRLSVEAAAGVGALVDDELQSGFYAFNRSWLERRQLQPSTLSVIAVRGDSMEPKLSDGDLILVDRAQRQIADGISYVIRLGSDLLVKYVQRLGPNTISLISENRRYPPREIDIEAVNGEVEIIGRVVASMHEW